MLDFVKRSSTLGVIVILAVVVAWALPVYDTEAAPKGNVEKPGDILPAGGKTVGGPAILNFEYVHGLTTRPFSNHSDVTIHICCTFKNAGPVWLALNVGPTQTIVNPGETRTLCQTLDFGESVLVETPETGQGVAFWRVDMLQ